MLRRALLVAVVAALVCAACTPSAPDFQKLKGRWLRSEGGYVIDVRGVDESGKLDAVYLNPRPIHVARAEATMDGAVMKVFLEQAVEQRRFQVAFARMR